MQKKGRRVPRKKRGGGWVIEIDVRAMVALCVTVVMGLLCALCLFLYARSFIGIRHFELTGISRYSERDVMDASRLKYGDRLYTLDFERVEEQILSECPYLESVEVSTRFPNTVCFSVEERIPQWYIDLAGDYYVLDNNMIVITEAATEEELIREGVTKLCLPNVTRVMHGELPEFAMKDGVRDETELKKTLELIATVRKTTFQTRITELDLSDRFAITMVVDGTYQVALGDMTAFEAKLREVERILDSDEAKSHSAAAIDVSVVGVPATFKPIT